MTVATSKNEKVVSQADWLAARKELLRKEKEFTRLRDQLSRQRRELPWETVEKRYVFDSPKGKQSLSDLFGGKSQLIVYHFMSGPGWKEGCPSCSLLADTFDGAAVHLAQRDVNFVAVSRTTLPEIEAFKKRMGWRFNWVSSSGSDFNFDYHVSFSKEDKAKGKVYYNYDLMDFPSEEAPGASVFYKNGRAKSSIPIPVMRVDSTSSWARTTTSTLRPRGATKRAWRIQWPGSAITTATPTRIWWISGSHRRGLLFGRQHR